METIERIKVSSIVNQAGTADLGNSDPKIAQSGNGQEPANEATKEQTPERLLPPQTNPRPPTSAETLRIGLNKLAEDSDSGSDMDTGDSDDSLSSADSDVAATPEKPTYKHLVTSFETVLFPTSTLFESADQFYDQCQTKLESSYGYRTNRYAQEAHYLIAACTMRYNRSCRFSVRVRRREAGDWELDVGKTRWTHSHGPKKEEGGRKKSENLQVMGEDSSSSKSESESESEEEPLIKQTARIPSTSSEIRFDVTTSSKAVLDIVFRREEVFTLQRRLQPSPRQQTSEKLVEDELESLPIPEGQPKAVYCYEHAKFLQFAELAKIPPYPISSPLIALYLSYKASLSAGTQGTSRAWLNRLHRLLDPTWEDQPTYKTLNEWADAEEGIREYMRGRADSRARPLKSPAVVKKPLPAHPHATRVQLNSSDVESAHETDDDWSHADTRSDQQSDKETSEEDSDDETVIGGSSDSERKERTSRTQKRNTKNGRGSTMMVQSAKTTVPGLPAVNETVASPVTLYKLCVQQHMKTLAINVNLIPSSTESYRVSCSRHHGRFANTPTGLCQFSIAIERIEKRWTVQSYSNFIHNHGAAPERLADPEWLPQIRNSDAREALGLRPISSSKTEEPQKKHKLSNKEETVRPSRKENDEMPKKKKKKRSRHTPIPSFSLSQQSYPSPAASDQPYHSPQPHVRAPPPQETFRRPSIPQPQARIQPVIPVPAPACSSIHTQATSTPRSAPITPAQSEEEFFTTLNSFLSSLHPSLTSLAPALFASGVRSFDVLSLFPAFETTTIDLYLTLLKNQYEVSNVHLKIFKKKLIEAKEEGWMN